MIIQNYFQLFNANTVKQVAIITMEVAPLTGIGQMTGISGDSRSFACASESGRNFAQVLKLVMSSCPACGSNVGSGDEDDTIVNGDWSLALSET